MLIDEAELCVVLRKSKLWENICFGAIVIIHIFHCHYSKKVVLKFVSFSFDYCIKHEMKVSNKEAPSHKKCYTYTAFTMK